MTDLDFIDRRIVGLLRRDPRATYQQMSQRVGLSRTAVRSRLHHLLACGTVRMTGVPHPRTQGLTTAAELLVDTALPAEQVAAAVGERPYLTVGYADELVVVSLWCRDDAELADIADRLRTHPQARSVEVFRVVHLLRPALAAPSALDEDRLRLDDLDHQLMGLLAGNPRAAYVHLGDQVELSPSATRARVQRLLNTGALILTVAGSSGVPAAASRIGITLQTPASNVALDLLGLPGLTYLAAGYGRHTLLARLVTPPDQQRGLYRRIREIPGVRQVRVWRTTCEDDLPVLEHHERR